MATLAKLHHAVGHDQRVLEREGLGDPGTRRPAIHAERFAALAKG